MHLGFGFENISNSFLVSQLFGNALTVHVVLFNLLVLVYMNLLVSLSNKGCDLLDRCSLAYFAFSTRCGNLGHLDVEAR